MLNATLIVPDLGLMPAASVLSLDAGIAGLILTLGLVVSALAVMALALAARLARPGPAPGGGARAVQPRALEADTVADASCA
jgi:hypothetical protein